MVQINRMCSSVTNTWQQINDVLTLYKHCSNISIFQFIIYVEILKKFISESVMNSYRESWPSLAKVGLEFVKKLAVNAKISASKPKHLVSF